MALPRVDGVCRELGTRLDRACVPFWLNSAAKSLALLFPSISEPRMQAKKGRGAARYGTTGLKHEVRPPYKARARGDAFP